MRSFVEEPDRTELHDRMDALRRALAGVAPHIEVHLMGREVYERTKDVPGTLAYWLAWRDAAEHMDMAIREHTERRKPDPESSVLARSLTVTDRDLIVELEDGTTHSVPIALFPILADATPTERQWFERIGNGVWFHWPELDEDISTFSIVYPERTMAMRQGPVLRILRKNRARRRSGEE